MQSWRIGRESCRIPSDDVEAAYGLHVLAEALAALNGMRWVRLWTDFSPPKSSGQKLEARQIQVTQI